MVSNQTKNLCLLAFSLARNLWPNRLLSLILGSLVSLAVILGRLPLNCLQLQALGAWAMVMLQPIALAIPDVGPVYNLVIFLETVSQSLDWRALAPAMYHSL
jgi:hypothetical protein